jgi:hypothetical protein
MFLKPACGQKALNCAALLSRGNHHFAQALPYSERWPLMRLGLALGVGAP